MNPIAAIEEPQTRRRAATTQSNTEEIREIINKPIGDYLKQKRPKPMQSVADDIGCDISYLSKIENNHVVPPWDMVQRLANHYSINKTLIPALAWKHLMQSRQDQFAMAIAFSGLRN